MKKIYSWIIIFVVAVSSSYYLYTSGQQHQVMIENTAVEGFKPPKSVSYFFNDGKEMKVGNGKKARAFVKGTSHQLKVVFKNDEGKTVEIVKNFKAGINKNIVISIGNLVQNNENWIAETRLYK